MILKVLFFLFLFIILYAYVGYTLLLLILSKFKQLFKYDARPSSSIPAEPSVTLLIPAYNEGEYVIEKARNCKDLNYPAQKLHILWVTDGTTDNTAELLLRYPEFKIIHEKERRGKIHAMNRGIKQVHTPLVVFTDANTMLNSEAIREIVQFFSDDKTGCVTGEKRISGTGLQVAVGAGEGLYWQYESWIKRLESDTSSVMGAVGEIFAVRTALYDEVKEDTLLDDFTVSMQIMQKGYSIRYAPKAWGTETASLNIQEELKRKTRIAAGGMQALVRMPELLNPFHHGIRSLMYISHKVLRWTLVPVGFPLLFLLNLMIFCDPVINNKVFTLLFMLQCIFYLFVLAGRILQNVSLGLRILFAPYYLFIMNFAIIRGFLLFITGRHTVKWQKVKRS
jgi:cellulose synthase/poly-beta-1,6-N-acetylglucosamine synthase-like glycosyltransferase